jgi:methylenetetrahydrofolate dehydrogenase (NADP+)/methenyltetrahydrofolate cyclohydrolase
VLFRSPKHINEKRVLNAIDPDKDVDGLHPMNMGRLMIGEARFYPCTPFGIKELLGMAGVKTKGAEVVVVGRSNLVGKPNSDILIVAAGKAKAITADMVKDGAVVIDVGVNRLGMTPEGKAKLCGDVDFETVKEKASVITPVPGGVGPMTITMLMQNTLKAAEIAAEGK